MMALLKPLFRQSFASSGVYLLIIALSLAISATTALKFSNSQIQQAVALQAAKMQAADLVLSDTQPIAPTWKDKAQLLKLSTSEVTVFSSMAHTQDQFVMVSVKAIEDTFPLRGELHVSPSQPKIASGDVWLSQRAMQLLNVKIGDTVSIADGVFKFTALIERDSNQELGFAGFSPTVIISQSDIAKTNAIQPGSRIQYRVLMAGDNQQVQEFTRYFKSTQQTAQKSQNPDQINADMDESQRLKLITANDGNTRLVKPIENLDTFLQLANILTILLCGIAIALTSQRYVQQNQDHIALLRCLGAKRNQIFTAYMVLLLVVIVIAVIAGSVFGVMLGFGLLQLMIQLIPNLELNFSILDLIWGPLPIAILTSAVVLFGFVLPSLSQLLNTPPIRVIRQQEKSSRTIGLTFATGLLSIIIFSLVLTENMVLSSLVIGAVIVLTSLIFLLVWMMLKSLKGLKNKLSTYIRLPAQTALQITALALGLSLITVLVVLRTDLLERWQQQIPEGTPNQFVYGLPPFEVDQFRDQLAKAHWKSTPLYPNIRGRLIAKNGAPFSAELIKQSNSLQRELNLTQSNQYPEDNVIQAGQKVLQKPGEVSVEAKTAEELNIHIGDTLTFSLPEGNLEAKVINLRTVEWQSFSPNFFFIFAPKSMDENAGSYLGSFYVPPEDKPQLVKLIQQFSNTVFIDVSLILDEIKKLVNVLVQIVTVLAVLVSLSGFLVLIACINLLMDERKREVALMRSFGSSKKQLKTMMTLEIGLIGLIAGIVSCLFAEVMSAIVSQRMNLDIQMHIEIWLILPLLMMLLCGLIGRYRLSYLSEIPPLQSLREINQS